MVVQNDPNAKLDFLLLQMIHHLVLLLLFLLRNAGVLKSPIIQKEQTFSLGGR